jgi:D-glycero-D-manno-heptose 1,7-bisphosphate phosphatase
MTRRFALVDRDGTINVERGHLTDLDDLELIPGAAAALRRMRDDLGLGIVVITNQAHVGRGLLSAERLSQIHLRLVELLAYEGAEVDGFLHCPHTPEDGCDCRKPEPGMARQAAERFGFDLREAFMIGDHASDVAMGRAVGATTVLVLTGHGRDEAARAAGAADHTAADLAAAVDIIATLVPRKD